MFLDGRPENTHIYDEKRSRGRRGVTTAGTSRPREITHVALKYAIFVEDFRVPEDPGGEVRVGASRGTGVSSWKIVLHA